MKTVRCNGVTLGEAADRDGLRWLLSDIGFRGDIVTIAETENAFILQSLHPTEWDVIEGRMVGVMGFELGATLAQPSSSMQPGDPA